MEAATQMKAVMGADPRPNCLIIDEIDGAPQVHSDTLSQFRANQSLHFLFNA
jgi:chromosome transmission fidelity protein 18